MIAIPLVAHPQYSVVMGAVRKTRAKNPPVIEAADRNRARIALSVRRAFDVIRKGLKQSEIQEALESRSIATVFVAADIRPKIDGAFKGAGLDPKHESFRDALQRTLGAGADAGIAALDKVQVKKFTIATAMSFTLINPRIMEYLEATTFNLIRGIAEQTEAAIRAQVIAGFQEGRHPRVMAREIRNLIGLTDRQSVAVNNYRRMLEEGRYREALSRELRDARFDPMLQRAVENESRLSAKQIDRMVTRYRERQLNYRAEIIARTESIKAANAGQFEAWMQAADQGLLELTTRRKWIISPDERTCETCKRIVALNPEGVPLSNQFVTDEGPLWYPPAHPSCRCSTGLVIQ